MPLFETFEQMLSDTALLYVAAADGKVKTVIKIHVLIQHDIGVVSL